MGQSLIVTYMPYPRTPTREEVTEIKKRVLKKLAALPKDKLISIYEDMTGRDTDGVTRQSVLDLAKEGADVFFAETRDFAVIGQTAIYGGPSWGDSPTEDWDAVAFFCGLTVAEEAMLEVLQIPGPHMMFVHLIDARQGGWNLVLREMGLHRRDITSVAMPNTVRIAVARAAWALVEGAKLRRKRAKPK